MEHRIPYFSSIEEAFRKNAGIQNLQPHFELYVLDRYPENEVQEIKPFRLNAYVIGFITDGEAELTINAGKIPLKRGALYFSSPWDVRSYSKMKNWKGFLLFFTDNYLSQFSFTENKLADISFFQPDARVCLALPENETVKLESLFKHMVKELENNNPFKLKLMFHYVHILLYQCRLLYENLGSPVQKIAKPSLSSDFLQEVNRYFAHLNQEKVEEQLSVNTIAAQLHIHPHYLSDLVKKQTGKTPTQIIRERYVLEAKTLLRNSNMSVSEIAYYLQFKDSSNFSKFFRNIAGYSPKEFREDPSLL